MASFSNSIILHYVVMFHREVFINKNLNKKMNKVNTKISNSCSSYFSFALIKYLDKGNLREKRFILTHTSRLLSIMV